MDYNAERLRGNGESEESKIRVLIPAEINSLLDAESDMKYRTLFMLAIFSGARQGELLGLKWSDVDWKTKQIHIQRTFNNQRWYSTKTDASKRKVDLGPATMQQLKEWKLACPPNAIFELNGSKMVANNKKGAMAKTITP